MPGRVTVTIESASDGWKRRSLSEFAPMSGWVKNVVAGSITASLILHTVVFTIVAGPAVFQVLII